MQKRPAGLVVAAAVFLFCLGTAHAEDGYDLWLRYRPLPIAEREALAPLARTIVTAPGNPSPTVRAAITELERGLGG